MLATTVRYVVNHNTHKSQCSSLSTTTGRRKNTRAIDYCEENSAKYFRDMFNFNDNSVENSPLRLVVKEF